MNKGYAIAICCSALIVSLASCSKPPIKEPGGTGADTQMALNNPDEYAWQIFLFLSRQARPGMAGVADPAKNFGELDTGAPLVWETWALASGESASEVFHPDGSRPADWEKLVRTSRNRPLILSPNKTFQMLNEANAPPSGKRIGKGKTKNSAHQIHGKLIIFPPDASGDREEEVRLNRAAYEAIRELRMYNAEGLEALLDAARKTNDRFLISKRIPPSSKEVKADWIPIDSSQKDRFLWRESSGKIYGLIALHITTKDLTNWFWADFGHRDCETLAANACPPIFKRDADNMAIDTTTQSAGSGQGEVRKETEGTVWANYLLRGTETAFTRADGTPEKLSNPVIERREQRTSCITCHANATVGTRQAVAVSTLGFNRSLGIPNPSDFTGNPKQGEPLIKYLQTDFMWSPPLEAHRIDQAQ